MNSWGNDKLERKIDELLLNSVSAGAEPKGFQVNLMPQKPKFPWLVLLLILAGAFAIGVIAVNWLVGQNLDYATEFSYETISSYFSALFTVETLFIVAIIFGIGGILLSFFPYNKQVLNLIK